MVLHCIVRGCKSVWFPGTTVKYHTFPKDNIKLKLWLSKVPLKNKLYVHAKICSLHFAEADFVGNYLKDSAVPFYNSTTNKDEHVQPVYDTGLEEPSTSKPNVNTPSQLVMKYLYLPSELLPSTSTGTERKRVFTEVENLVHKEKVYMNQCDVAVQTKTTTPEKENLQKINRILKQKVNRQNKKITNMTSLLAIVKEYTSNSEIENIIQGRFGNLCEIFTKKQNKPHGIRYSEEVKSFALTLHFYSPKAFEFIKKYTNLPHVETLRRSLSLFDCNVGFLCEVFNYLKEQVKLPKNYHLKNVAVIFDSMSLKHDLAYDQKLDKVFGYVDYGPIPVSDPEKLACEALVFQIVSYSKSFKCPVAYFFTQNSMVGELLAQLIKTAIILLKEINITVRSLTCDGAASNLKAIDCLGCSLNQNDFRPYFEHPTESCKVYCLLDAAHMLKLARNVLADFTIKSEEGDISFEYIRKLHQVQKEEGLKFSNKLTSTHVHFKNKKMNVRLAAQVISSSVADAIDFLRLCGHPGFENSQATSEFLHMIDRLFDIMNSKSPFGKGYKSPLSLDNRPYWEQIFEKSKIYLQSLSIGEKKILDHPRKTFALGFLMNIKSLTLLVTDLCTNKDNALKYLLSYKCSQDNLEIFFSCIRARGRTQDNPSPLEFRYILRKMLFRNTIRPSINANCLDVNGLEVSSHILDFNKKPKSLLELSEIEEPTFAFEQMLHNLNSTVTSSYQENILYYITGYIIKQIITHISCPYCHEMLISPDDMNSRNDHTYALGFNKYQTFTKFVNRGKLCFPSIPAYKIIKYTDKVFKNALSSGHLIESNIQNKLLNIALQHFTPLVQQMFHHPSPVSITCSDLHEIKIIKRLASCFLKIRIKAYVKNNSKEIFGQIRSKRQKLHKTILFSHV